MIDRIKYPKLYERTEDTIATRRRWLEEAIKAQELCDLLPDEIKALNIISVDFNDPNQLSITISNSNGTIRILKMLGIQGLKPLVSTWSKKSFYSQGEGKLPNGATLSIHVGNIEQPKGCHIVEKRKWKMEYELVCEGTGKKIK